MRHRDVKLDPGQDARDVLGAVLWQHRRDDGGMVIVRALRAPVPHVRVEVWRAGTERAVCLDAGELVGVAMALFKAPRAWARKQAA